VDDYLLFRHPLRFCHRARLLVPQAIYLPCASRGHLLPCAALSGRPLDEASCLLPFRPSTLPTSLELLEGFGCEALLASQLGCLPRKLIAASMSLKIGLRDGRLNWTTRSIQGGNRSLDLMSLGLELSTSLSQQTDLGGGRSRARTRVTLTTFDSPKLGLGCCPPASGDLRMDL
jgi:hypothetical protein